MCAPSAGSIHLQSDIFPRYTSTLTALWAFSQKVPVQGWLYSLMTVTVFLGPRLTSLTVT